MSINVSGAMVSIARSMSISLDLGKLGPRQFTALKRALETGVVNGYSPPMQIATHVLRCNNKPIVIVHRNMVEWHEIPQGHELFDRLKAGLVAYQIEGERHQYYAKHISDGLALVEKQPAAGRSIAGRHMPKVLKTLKLSEAIPVSRGDVITVDLLKGFYR